MLRARLPQGRMCVRACASAPGRAVRGPRTRGESLRSIGAGGAFPVEAVALATPAAASPATDSSGFPATSNAFYDVCVPSALVRLSPATAAVAPHRFAKDRRTPPMQGQGLPTHTPGWRNCGARRLRASPCDVLPSNAVTTRRSETPPLRIRNVLTEGGRATYSGAASPQF